MSGYRMMMMMVMMMLMMMMINDEDAMVHMKTSEDGGSEYVVKPSPYRAIDFMYIHIYIYI